MTVKKRISLYIIGAGLITSILFSVVLFLEMLEQPYDVLDRALKDEAYSITKMFLEQKKKLNIETFDSDFIPDYFFWLKIKEQNSNKILYESRMAKLIKLHSIKPGKRGVETIKISPEIIRLHQDKSNMVALRIRAFLITQDGKTFIVQIARSMKTLTREIRQVRVGLFSGFLLSAFILIFLSRYITEKILEPIATMKELAENISEKNLDTRIPTSPEQDEFNDLARTINKMLDRLQNSFIKQRTFLFDTSHELKTPLTTMLLAIDNIFTSESENLPSHTKETLSQLNNQVLRMEQLVKNLLNLSSLETLTGIDRMPVNMTDLLSSLTTDYHFIAEAQNVQMDLKLSKELTLEGDLEKLTRAFSNLLDNAIKYNVDGGRIEITSIKSKNNLIIEIGNTGPGIARDDINKVFDQFYRVEQSRSLQHGGYGLGLAIVKKIIELHNGKIKLKSKPGIWTQITVTLPLS